MGRFSIRRLLAPDAVRPLSKSVCPTTTTVPQWTRLFSQSPAANTTQTPPRQAAPQTTGGRSSAMSNLARNVMGKALRPGAPAAESDSLAEQLGVDDENQPGEPYHFHIYSHKHNTHITLTKPNRDALLSLSCGNIGFKKSGRKHYDSAYQLGAYVIDKMHQKGLVKKIHELEVVLRGFGAGREAVVKVLMGNEGKTLRPKIVRVSDATRLKFGGTRSPRKRRLG